MSFIITVSFIHKKNYVLLLSHIYNYFEKSYKWVWDLRTLAHFQGSEMSPDGIRAWAVLSIKNFFCWSSPHRSTFAPPNSSPQKSAWHSSGVQLSPLPLKQVQETHEPGLYLHLANFLTFNPRQYESNYHKQCLLIVTKFHLISASDYKFHAFTIQVHTHTPTSKAYSLF